MHVRMNRESAQTEKATHNTYSNMAVSIMCRLLSLYRFPVHTHMHFNCALFFYFYILRVASSIPARSHIFVEIDHEIISTVILLPSADSFKKGRC